MLNNLRDFLRFILTSVQYFSFFDRPFSHKMSPRTEKQYEAMRQHRREQLMEAGLRLFAELGFENTSISLIAREAGISKGLMYNYFKSKDELLGEVVRRGIEEMLMPLGGEPRPFTSQEDLRWFVRTNLNELMGNQHHWKLYYQLLLQPAVSSRFEKQQREVSEPWMRFLIAYFEQKGHSDSRIQAFVFGALLNGIGLNLVMNPRYLDEIGVSLDELVNRVVEGF